MNLMQGLTQLKLAIDAQDWTSVIAAYELITGEKITLQQAQGVKLAEPKKRGRPKKTDTKKNSSVVGSGSNEILLGRDKKPNKFVDNGKLHAEDREIDAKLHVVAPVQRRQAATILELNCDSCRRKYTTIPDLVLPGARKLCNDCSRISR